jgi:hypothetical protein
MSDHRDLCARLVEALKQAKLDSVTISLTTKGYLHVATWGTDDEGPFTNDRYPQNVTDDAIVEAVKRG